MIDLTHIAEGIDVKNTLLFLSFFLWLRFVLVELKSVDLEGAEKGDLMIISVKGNDGITKYFFGGKEMKERRLLVIV